MQNTVPTAVLTLYPCNREMAATRTLGGVYYPDQAQRHQAVARSRKA